MDTATNAGLQTAGAVAKAEVAAKAETEVAGKEAVGKEAIYVKLAALVKEKTDKNIGKSGGRVLFDTVVEEVFALAARDKAFRFNAGFGSLHLKTYQAGSRRLPNGAVTTFGERVKLRYEEGVMVQELVQNGGDLAKAKASHKAENAAADPAAVELK